MSTKELLALVDKWRGRSDMDCYVSAARSAYSTAADELAPIAAALCAEVSRLTLAEAIEQAGRKDAEAEVALLQNANEIHVERNAQQDATITNYIAMRRESEDRAVEHLATIARLEQALADWPDAFKAFKGAFDTPAAWRKHGDEYANDARRRINEINERIAALNQGEGK